VNDDAAGVLMLKPGVVASDQAMAELAMRLDRFGYAMGDVRTIPFAQVRERRLLRRHYHDHFEVARAGRLLPDEHTRLIELHDTATFRRDFGDPAAIDVVSTDVVAEGCGVDPSTIARWAEDAATRYGIDSGHPLACNEVGELADVQLLPVTLTGADRPVFVVNPQMLSLARWWEDGPDDTVVALVRPSRLDPRPWPRVRSDFLGTGSPAGWPTGSIRRDMLDGRSALRYRDGIEMGIARNGVHLSNGPIEALRELSVWFDRAPGDLAVGSMLIDAGLDLDAILAAVYLEDETGVHALSGRTAHLDVPALVAVLRGARLLRADQV
jgi:hypothetical protein